ncbi:nitroreductase family protein [Bordetella holmesii]|uniref:Putative NAD(P)H nitroreductase n=2 Tax=Bordetella holmesii TaxID=35814 RepID=A0A158M8M5_9BORD|nr:nitroreductase [Bordetella holmesii]AHV93591.1 nitroreductase family protein [Bordetella holmesii ATCC 51541]AIT24864.1 nitroreductase family protein [Bordetella holmesii 44057]EWM45435.1 nitroreductase family protein [Bordetella holmesii 70147]EWM48565.1 nitroreductase family protein [Bordetella holmesii 41130]AMD44142.1 nitroreductase [Bordetella holmesii H558]
MTDALTQPALHALNTRRSVKFLRGPAPKPDEQALILQAAMSAPDHGALRPWRFVRIQGDAIARFADVALDAVKRSGDARMTPEKEKSVRAWMADVPLFLALAAKIDHNSKVCEQEQVLAAGAAVMNILNATHMLGYGAFWSAGLGTYVEEVQEILGLDPLDYRFLGYLAIGTPACAVPQHERPDFHDFLSDWTGAEPAAGSQAPEV